MSYLLPREAIPRGEGALRLSTTGQAPSSPTGTRWPGRHHPSAGSGTCHGERAASPALRPAPKDSHDRTQQLARTQRTGRLPSLLLPLSQQAPHDISAKPTLQKLIPLQETTSPATAGTEERHPARAGRARQPHVTGNERADGEPLRSGQRQQGSLDWCLTRSRAQYSHPNCPVISHHL